MILKTEFYKKMLLGYYLRTLRIIVYLILIYHTKIL